jgi:hypothetical protein
MVLYASAVIVCGLEFFRRSTAGRVASDADRTLFLGTALVAGVGLYAVFLLVLSYPTQPWYYIAIMAFLAVTLDATFQLLVGTSRARRAARLVVFLVISVVSTFSVWPAVQRRYTNVDQVVTQLARGATANDLVLVTFWETGITFSRYYRGAAPWMTLPDIEDHRVHRYDLVKQWLARPEPLRHVLGSVGRTLETGHRVWIVGDLPFVGPQDGPGDTMFSITAYYLQTRALRIDRVPVAPGHVNPYEHLPILVAEGWR